MVFIDLTRLETDSFGSIHGTRPEEMRALQKALGVEVITMEPAEYNYARPAASAVLSLGFGLHDDEAWFVPLKEEV